MLVLIGSDLHGSSEHLSALIRTAETLNVGHFIFLGDYSPRTNHTCRKKPDMWPRDPAKQQVFFRTHLLPVLTRMPCPCTFMPGNSDFACNLPVFQTWCDEAGCDVRFVSNDIAHLCPDHVLCCLATVAVSHHRLKDFEAEDFRGDTGRPRATLSGVKSTASFGVEVCDLAEQRTLRDILHELGDKLSSQPDATVLFCSHGPPRDTHLDVVAPNPKKNRPSVHVGSVSVRRFLEQHPAIAAGFCGHIHETVQMTGKWKDMVGSVVCYSTGADPFSTFFCLVYDTLTGEIQRIELDVSPVR